jgi:hypothetical protein
VTFRNWGATHNVRYHQTGSKRLRHPTVGALELDYEVMQLSADSGLLLAIFSAEPGSRSAQALDLLASWAATPEHISSGGRDSSFGHQCLNRAESAQIADWIAAADASVSAARKHCKSKQSSLLGQLLVTPFIVLHTREVAGSKPAAPIL